MRTPARISVVVPVLDEEDNLRPLYERLAAVLDAEGCAWEILFVDDGSRDHSESLMRALHESDRRVRALFFTRNFGHERALTAGLDHAEGDVAVIMDADLQDSPELIPALLQKWREGYDVVGARRSVRRGEGVLKRLAAFLFYRAMRRLATWELPLDTGNFCLVDRRVVEAFRQCREANRSVRVLLSWTGFRQTAVTFERPPRRAGRSKYDARGQLALALTSVIGFSLLPLRLIQATGMVVAAGALAALAVLLVRAAVGQGPSALWFLGAGIWFLAGVQCLCLGVVGEYVGRTLMESQRRPLYCLRDTLGIEAKSIGAAEPAHPLAP